MPLCIYGVHSRTYSATSLFASLLTQVEALSEITSDYVPVTVSTEDRTLPNFASLLQTRDDTGSPPIVDLVAYLDRNKPLSEPKWVRTGDVEDLLLSVFAKNMQGRAAWASKVDVVDPDPVSCCSLRISVESIL